MVEYSVLFATKISAKSKADMEWKAEQTAEAMSKCLRKTVLAHSYAKVDRINSKIFTKENMLDKQATLD